MNFKRIGRMFLCLLLVCCLLFQASPIKAHATGFEGVLGGLTAPLPAPIVIGSILIGLGITAAETGVFEELVGFVEDKLEAAGEVVNGMIDTWLVSDGETETYTVSEGLIEGVFDATYDSGMVSFADISSFKIPAMTRFRLGIYGACANIDCSAFVYSYWNYPRLVLYTTDPGVIFYDTYFSDFTKYPQAAHTVDIDGVTYYYYYQDSVTWEADIVAVNKNADYVLTGVVSGDLDLSVYDISAVEGLDATKLAAQDILNIADAYKNWDANKVLKQDSEDPDKKMPYWPIAPMDTLELTANTTQEDVWAGLHDYTTTVLDNWDLLLNGLTSIKNGILNIPNAISNGVAKLQAAIEAIPQTFERVISEVKDAIYSIPDAFSNWMTQLLNLIQQLWDTIANIFAIVRDAVLEALSLAFALDPAYMEAEFNSLISDFEFFGSMVDFGRGVVDVFYGIGSKPPVLYIDLGAAEGDILWGERVVFLDLSWYERYKPYGDAIISSFLWAFFGWRLLHHIPGLINGSSGIVPHIK